MLYDYYDLLEDTEVLDQCSKPIPNNCRLVATFYTEYSYFEDAEKETWCEIRLIEPDGYTSLVGKTSKEISSLYAFKNLVFGCIQTPEQLFSLALYGAVDNYEG